MRHEKVVRRHICSYVHNTRVFKEEAITFYGAHVHNKTCSDNNSGGHYQHMVGGGVNSNNKIWSLFTTNAVGIGYGKVKNNFYARLEARSIEIHDTDGARYACADLMKVGDMSTRSGYISCFGKKYTRPQPYPL